jgi:hypothetical protein
MKLSQLSAWPPMITDGRGRLVSDAAVLLRSEFIPTSASLPAHVVIVVFFEGRTYRSSYRFASEAMLVRLAASLKGREGLTIEQTRDLELDDPYEP